MKSSYSFFLFSISIIVPNNISAHEVDNVAGILHLHPLDILAFISSCIIALALLRSVFIKEVRSNV